MYTIQKHPNIGVVVTVGLGPIVDLLDVIVSLERDKIGVVKVEAAGDEYDEQAKRIDRLLYDCGFDVT